VCKVQSVIHVCVCVCVYVLQNSIDKAQHTVNGSDPALSVHPGVYRQLPSNQQVSEHSMFCSSTVKLLIEAPGF